MCNLDCVNCTYEECINDGELNNAIYCRSWYDRNKEKKREYQREYARRKRQNKKNKTNTPINVSLINKNVLKSEYEGCSRCKRKLPIKARGLCNACYVYEHRYGNIKNYDRKYEGMDNVQQVPQQESNDSGRTCV